MTFNIKRDGDMVLVEILGQLIVGNRQELKLLCMETHASAKLIVLDFAKCGYVDSSGLGVLNSVHTNMKKENRELWVTNLVDEVRTLFELTKMDTILNIGTPPSLQDLLDRTMDETRKTDGYIKDIERTFSPSVRPTTRIQLARLLRDRAEMIEGEVETERSENEAQRMVAP